MTCPIQTENVDCNDASVLGFLGLEINQASLSQKEEVVPDRDAIVTADRDIRCCLVPLPGLQLEQDFSYQLHVSFHGKFLLELAR